MPETKDLTPMVTVIMPAYNAEKYIAQAIESVFKQKVSADLIIIDDCSVDKTADIVKSYQKDDRLIYVKNAENLGAAESRNVGIRMAKGEYIAFLDADDWWSAGKLKKQLAFLEKRKGILCCTGRELMHENGETMGKTISVPEKITYQMLLKTNSIPLSSALVKTSVVREFYMNHGELHEDYILWLNILKKYECAYGLNEPMLKSRMSPMGKSRNKWKSAKMQYGVYRLMGFGILKSVFYFTFYMINGILKYS